MQNHLVDSLTSEISKSLSLIAAGDPLAYQQIQAMETPVGESDDSTDYASDAHAALLEAQQMGFSYDPFSLEDIVYDANEINTFIQGGGTPNGHSLSGD